MSADNSEKWQVRTGMHQPLGISPCDVPSVLFLRPQSASIDKQTHLARLHSQSLIEWWRRRLERRHNVAAYIIVHTDREEQDLASLSLPHSNVVRLPYSSQTHSLSALASLEKIEHLALVTLGTALLPTEDLDDLISIHLAGRNEISWCTGMPSGVSPCFLSGDILQSLAKLDSSWVASHPLLTYRRLHEFKAPGTTADRVLSMKHHRFDLGARYHATPAEMPLQISFEEQEAIEIAREILDPLEDPRGIDGLRSWKTALIARKHRFVTQHLVEPPSPFVAATERRPRVLYVSNASAYSGAEESLCQMVQKIDRSRYDVFAAVGLPSRLQRRLQESGAVVTAFADGFKEPTVRNFVQVRDLISRVQPDIIHSNALNGLPLLWSAIEGRIPFIQHVRNGNMNGYAEYVESSSAVIAISEYLRDRLLRFAINPQRVHVVYNEVDLEHFNGVHFDRSTSRNRHGFPQDAKIIAMIARFARNKRHDLMLKAFESILHSVPSAHLLLKGEDYHDDPYYDTVLDLIERCPCKERIRHVKFVNDIREIHAAADVLVLCSDREGLGRCVVEAMSMGVPVVVTDSGGTHEIVEDGVTGLVVPGGNAIELADAVIAILKDDPFRKRASLSARRIAVNRLSSAASAAAVMQIYDNVLGIRHSAPSPATLAL